MSMFGHRAALALIGAWAVLLGGIVVNTPVQAAPAATRAEMRTRDQWLARELLGGRAPFSFAYGGRPTGALLSTWRRQTGVKRLDALRTQRTLTWTDPATGLVVRCAAVTYADFPVAEWTVTLRNDGTADTPVIEGLQALDAQWECPADARPVLHYWKGDSCTPDSYEPLTDALEAGKPQRFAPAGGRPTNGAFPYYDLQMPGGGLMLAVGWPGQWAATFERDASGVRVTAGQELTHLVLHPGEEVRTPLVALLFWRGDDTVRAHNLWRRWMLAHNVPRQDGKLPKPMYIYCSGGFFPGLKVSEASEKEFIDTLEREKVPIDVWWMDAGWYPCPDWPLTGTWEPDQARFPRGIRGVSDYVHARGMKLIVWFEPERVEAGSWLATNHPEWLLGGKLLNLGNPAARTWLTDHVDGLLREQGIDYYRQDFNMDPLAFWRAADAPDRQGMTENLHVRGYLAYWDELRRRHPGLLIDSCASGGRRNDLETLRRAVPLLRSDYQAFDGNPAFAPGNQGHTYGLSSWVPYYGTGVYWTDTQLAYCVRSYMCPSFGICVDVRKPSTDWELYRRLADQWRQVVGSMLGDYYPLTPYSLADDRWLAWQFDRPEEGDGLVQAFRRPGCADESLTVRLHGLEPGATYAVTDLDRGTTEQATGRDLSAKGLVVRIGTAPGAALVQYRRAR